jgi:hypothetical protein
MILVTNQHCRTLIVQRTATIALTPCLSPRVDFKLPSSPSEPCSRGNTCAKRHCSPDVILYRPYRLYLDIVLR